MRLLFFSAPCHANGRTRVFPHIICGALTAMLILFVTSDATAQFDEWQAHTAMREVSDVYAAGNEVWAATKGGLFSYHRDTGEIRRYTTVDGLSSIDVRTLAVDNVRGYVWMGYMNGVIDRLETDNGDVRSFRDIARATQFASRSINRLVLYEDELLVATDFGLVVFDPERSEVRSSYTRLAGLTPGSAVNDVIAAPLPDGEDGLWLAVNGGVAHAPLSHPNLQEPAAWTVETAGLPSTRVLALASFDGRVFAGTDIDLSVRGEHGTWARLFASNGPIRALAVRDEWLYGVEPFRFIVYDRMGTVQRIRIPGNSAPTSISTAADGMVWVGDGREGLAAAGAAPFASEDVEPVHRVIPDGPEHHFFLDFDFDAEQTLWAAGAQGGGTGFYSYKDGQWASYTAQTVPELEGRSSFWRAHVDRQGNAWFGAAGSGLAVRYADGRVETFGRENSTLNPAAGTSNTIIVRGIGSDADGNVWVTNQFASPHLSIVRPDGTWQAVPDPSGSGLPASALYDRILIDSNDFKWITLQSGLLVLDTGLDPTDVSQRRMRFYGSQGSGGRGLPSMNIRSVVEDRSGRVWIGTNRGIAFFFAPSFVFSNDPNAFEPQWPISDGAFFLRDLNVNYMTVDPADRLWIGSTTGAWLIQSTADGYEIVQHFTSENSPLLSDNVLAIGVHELTGRVFFATSEGPVSWAGDAVAPAPQASNLFVYPNPVRASNNGIPRVTIEGLVDATDLRIVTANGELIAAMETRGGRAQWDGLDTHGRPVPSGVYLIVAVGRNGEGTAHGKVAVIR